MTEQAKTLVISMYEMQTLGLDSIHLRMCPECNNPEIVDPANLFLMLGSHTSPPYGRIPSSARVEHAWYDFPRKAVILRLVDASFPYSSVYETKEMIHFDQLMIPEPLGD